MSDVKGLYVHTTIYAHEAFAAEGLVERRYDFLCEAMQEMAKSDGRAIVYPSLLIRSGPAALVTGVLLEMMAKTVPVEAV